MKLLMKFWQDFKTQPDIWFFYGFLLTFTLSIRKVIYFFPIEKNFNEYTGICLYLSDIFLFLTIAFWLPSLLRNKRCVLSSSITLLPALLVLWIFISIIWSENHWLALFRSIKILEFYVLFLYVSQKMFHLPHPNPLLKGEGEFPASLSIRRGKEGEVNIVPRLPAKKMFHVEHFWEDGTFLRNSLIIISVIALFQATIGIIQVIIQRSVGLFWFKESLISPEIPGVAKIILEGERYIRAYGLFPHPNILGGFLVFSIIATIYLIISTSPQPSPYKGEGGEFSSPYEGEDVPTFLKVGTDEVDIVPHGTFLHDFLKNSLGIQIIGLFLTFSKSAILGLFIALAYLVYKKVFYMFHVEHFKRKLLIILTIIALLVVIIKPDFYSLFQKSLEERLIYLNVSVETFLAHPIIGIGNGQFVLEMQKYISQKLQDWQFQPVHNVFLLILSELGLVGLLLFGWFLWKLFKILPHPNPLLLGEEEVPATLSIRRGAGGEVFKSLLLAFIFIMLFDHYLWDIQQGQILLWLTFGLIAGDNKNY